MSNFKKLINSHDVTHKQLNIKAFPVTKILKPFIRIEGIKFLGLLFNICRMKNKNNRLNIYQISSGLCNIIALVLRIYRESHNQTVVCPSTDPAFGETQFKD